MIASHSDTKFCPKCEERRPLSAFNKAKDRKDGLQVYCKTCKYSYNTEEIRDRQKQKRKPKKSTKKEYDKTRQKEKSVEISEKRKKRAFFLKTSAFEKYGNKCACCGENDVDFLAIDHVNGRGTSLRKENKLWGESMYRFLVNTDMSSEFRILCHNCNWSAHLHGGTCIHKLKEANNDEVEQKTT